MNVSARTTLGRLLLSVSLLAVSAAAMEPGRAAAQPAPSTAPDGSPVTSALPPPALPVYIQPPMPGDGYIWTPGYWAWAFNTGYYWVPGTWVQPPEADVLWTPPYWGWNDGLYLFHPGYWGPHVGFYGGVNYGYGYGGSGYQGGRWDGGRFNYNRSVNNFGSVRIDHAYVEAVPGGRMGGRVSFNGGQGGVRAEPGPADRSAEQESRRPVTAEQARHLAAAAAHPGLVATHANGRPQVAATSHAAQFTGRGVVAPQREAVRPVAAPPAARPAEARPAEHAPAREEERKR